PQTTIGGRGMSEHTGGRDLAGHTANRPTPNGHERKRVVIVGGGFGGLFAVRALDRGPFAVTLVDQSEHHLFQPLLYQCATGILSGQITTPLRRVLHKYPNVECEMAKAVDVDVSERKVKCVRPLGEEIDLWYDHLIVAA